MGKRRILIIVAVSLLGVFTSRPANAQAGGKTKVRAGKTQSYNLRAPNTVPRATPAAISKSEVAVTRAIADLERARSDRSRAIADKVRQFENSPELKDAKKQVLDCVKAVADARAPIMARLSADPFYRQLLAMEAAAQKKVDALRESGASRDDILAAAQDALRVSGNSSAIQRAVEQADEALTEATQELADATRRLSELKESAFRTLAADPQLAGLDKTYDAAARALAIAGRKLFEDSSPIPRGAVTPSNAHLPRVAKVVPVEDPTIARDKLAIADARADLQNARAAHASLSADLREEFEYSPELLDAQAEVAVLTREIAAARARIMATLSADPAFKQLSETETAAQKKVDALKKAYGTRDQILAASTEVLRIGGLTSAVQRQAEQADATLATAMRKLVDVNRTLTKLKGTDANARANHPRLADLEKAQKTAAATLTKASEQLQKDSPTSRAVRTLSVGLARRGTRKVAGVATSAPQVVFNVPYVGPRR